MAKTIISRGQGVLTGAGDASELLQAGFTQKAFRQWLQQYPRHLSADTFASYIKNSVDSVIPVVSNATADIKTSPLDRLSSGNNLIELYRETNNETYKTAFEALRTSIDLQSRNVEGGLWYYTYANWSYLDGMASFAPFYTLYSSLYDEENTAAVPDDLVLQLHLLWTHCYNNVSGLLVHGYDESYTAVWADNVTGASPHVWGRSLGWYAMAMIDTLELLNSKTYAAAHERIKLRFNDLASALVQAVDSTTGAWWQILDQPGREGNYIESSGSAMFAYSLLKGARLGYLPKSVINIAKRGYEYIVDEFVVNNGNGTLGYNGTVAVCSLNSTATYEYYVGRPILYNSVLGSAAFVLASLEYEALEI
ncbi:Six-hairpin glycosidase-like protein [Lophiotrema nucula]|uniref:Six-hairpin glycosidase-like protein n=1 Tax=Lophiotrema nucula TaxID=690887 RepID=A0A6A5ZVX4_9PLEO|nr:Six-hairpin glycosidase-like protein [Lophiotrema nucula]